MRTVAVAAGKFFIRQPIKRMTAVVFYVVKSFWCKTTQFCVTRPECEMAETPSVGNGAQADENPRKNVTLG